ncbi:hypothetical protein [Polycladidibacter hongkongensis]|uniref:hypothetical protein n=1 Tax=Polycladidibacter hongkongensis TaxID=1647556 RepID=UPI0008346D7D|nr:hypothetical protein [Pseudovibrio hongkongensis]
MYSLFMLAHLRAARLFDAEKPRIFSQSPPASQGQQAGVLTQLAVYLLSAGAIALVVFLPILFDFLGRIEVIGHGGLYESGAAARERLMRLLVGAAAVGLGLAPVLLGVFGKYTKEEPLQEEGGYR